MINFEYIMYIEMNDEFFIRLEWLYTVTGFHIT